MALLSLMARCLRCLNVRDGLGMSVIALMTVMMSLGSVMVLIICGICEGLAVFMYSMYMTAFGCL
jgi:hypothetical protein